MEISELKGKVLYASTIPELIDWLIPKAKEHGFYITRKFTPDVDGVLECRKNVLRENVARIVRKVSKEAFANNIPYYSLEEVCGLFLDEAFFPVWVCNETSFIYGQSRSSIMYIPPDAGYDLLVEDLTKIANELGYLVSDKMIRGIEFVVVPTQVTQQNKGIVSEMLKLVSDKNLYAIREDALIAEHTKKNKSEHDKQLKFKKNLAYEQRQLTYEYPDYFPKEYIILDTEYKSFEQKDNEKLITEIAYLHIRDNKIIDKFDTLVMQEGIPLRSQRKYAKDDIEFVHQAMDVDSLKEKLNPLLKKYPLVGYGIKTDIQLLAETFGEAQYIEYLDVYDICKNRLGNSGRLYEVAHSLDLGNREAHRALNDCITILEVYQKCLEKKRTV